MRLIKCKEAKTHTVELMIISYLYANMTGTYYVDYNPMLSFDS